MAAPNPEKELDRLKRLVRGRLPGTVLVTGPSAFFRQEAIDLLGAAVPAKADLRTIDGQRETSGTELQDLRGGGLFSRAAVVLVRRGDDWLARHNEALLAAIPRIADGCSLILETQKLDKRTKVAKALGEAAEVFDFRELYDSPFDRSRSPLEAELVRWVVLRARKLGVPLTDHAAYLVVTQVGKQPGDLLAELQRIQDLIPAGDRERPLQPDDLRGKLTSSFESTPFEFAEAVLVRDHRRALRSLRAMFDRGVRSRDGATMEDGGVFPFATGWLYQSLATTLEGRILLDDGVPPGRLAKECGVHHFQDRFLAQVQANGAADLSRGILLLVECQRLQRLTSEDHDVCLERFLQAWFAGRTIAVPGAVAW